MCWPPETVINIDHDGKQNNLQAKSTAISRQTDVYSFI